MSLINQEVEELEKNVGRLRNLSNWLRDRKKTEYGLSLLYELNKVIEALDQLANIIRVIGALDQLANLIANLQNESLSHRLMSKQQVYDLYNGQIITLLKIHNCLKTKDWPKEGKDKLLEIVIGK